MARTLNQFRVRYRPPRALRALVVGFFALAASLANVGCETTTSRHGSSKVLAGYNFGTLEADLPDRMRVPAVIAAGEASLRHRGYSITSSASTAERGSVTASSPNAGVLSGSTEVSARVGGYGTRLGVKVGLLGDESESRAVLDEVLARLGL